MSDAVRNAAIDPAASFLVQAPAGSGKTELLTRRILRLLAVVEEPEEILALTFTRKAAAEMRGRVVEALSMSKPADDASHKMETWLLAQAANRRSEERGWHLAEHPSRLRMMTLDSFTHALARQLPLLSGLGEMPTPSTHVAPLYREAAEQAVAALVRRAPDQAVAVLLHQDHNMVALIALVADMLGKRDQWLREVDRHASDPAALRDMLEQGLAEIMRQQVGQCAALVPIEVRGNMPALLRFAGEQLQDPTLSGLHEWPGVEVAAIPLWQRIAELLLTRDKPAFRKRVDKTIGFPAGAEFAEPKRQFQEMLGWLAESGGLAEALDGLRRLPAEPRFDDGQWQVLEAQLSLLLLADRQLQRLFEQRGEADFIEIALRAMQALEDEAGNPTDLLLRLDYRIHHILVDEFQDTSLLQMRLLQNLTEGWQAGDGTHRTLFMVGDPMQSIYRFRKAEVGLFLLTAANKTRLPPVTPLKLTRNFRSSPVIVDWVNRAFASIFPAEPDYLLGAVAQEKADAALQHDGRVELLLQQQPDAAGEAAAVVATIRRELADEGQRIAVLSRSRKHLHAIMLALAEASIPYRAVDILPLHERPEIRLLRALLRALLHPADRLAWAALLRGPCCGVTTEVLHKLLAGDTRPVAAILGDEERLQSLQGEAHERLLFLREALAPGLRLAGRMAVRKLLQSSWERLGMPAVIGGEATRNVEAMLELVDEIDHGGLIDFAMLDERLEKLYAAPDASPAAARVELMTMHGAKGLQWDVVILPGLGYGKGRSDLPLLAFTDVPLPEGVQPLIAVRGAVRSSDAVYDLVRSVEKVRENNELSRLLYVACTRAETALYMVGHLPEASDEPASGSLLRLLLPGGIDGAGFGASIRLLEPVDSQSVQTRAPLTRLQYLPRLPELQAANAESESEYFWAGPEAAPVGNAVHAILQQVAEKGFEQWSAADSDAAGRRMRLLLMAEGLSGESLQRAEQRCHAALRQVLESERAAWLLSNRHAEAHCEWALSSSHDGSVANHVIDRSFVDADGVRWIVDYKTASHEGADRETFLAEEMKRHAAQLERYAATVRQLEPGRVIRLALYFPMLDGWQEWEPAHH